VISAHCTKKGGQQSATMLQDKEDKLLNAVKVVKKPIFHTRELEEIL